MQPPSSNPMPKCLHPRTAVPLLKRCAANLGLFERGGQDVVADSGNAGDADDSDDLSASSEDDAPGAGTDGGGVKGRARGLHAGGAMRTRFARVALIPWDCTTCPHVIPVARTVSGVVASTARRAAWGMRFLTRTIKSPIAHCNAHPLRTTLAGEASSGGQVRRRR
jgi:hypothetical protein